jgi:AcrR family transcriptional regulator
MPRITGDNIEAHVQAQEAAILDAAARLFVEQGFAETTLGDIADSVGLARNSLYRYFPDKEHILLRWFARESAPLADRTTEILDADEPALVRIDRWVDLQLDYVEDPAHAVGAQLMREAEALSSSARGQIDAGHRRLYEMLGRVVAEVTRRPSEATFTTSLITAMVAEAARRSIQVPLRRGERRRLHAAVRAVLGAEPA